MKRIVAILFLALCSSMALAQDAPDKGGMGDRWNGTGPSWYDTKCGLAGYTFGVGVGEDRYVVPCSIPTRICEFKTITINYPALPDQGCDKIAPWAGAVLRSELKRW